MYEPEKNRRFKFLPPPPIPTIEKTEDRSQFGGQFLIKVWTTRFLEEIRVEPKNRKKSFDSGLLFGSICSIGILHILKYSDLLIS